MEPKFTPVNTCIMGINIAVFLVMTAAGEMISDSVYLMGAIEWNQVLNGGEYYRLFTSMFLHFGVDHLFQNMVFLFFIGCIMEEALGSVKYIFFYLFSGVGAGLVSALVNSWERAYAISAGASGAIFGIVGGLAYIVIRNKGRYEGIGMTGMLIMILGSLSYGFTGSGIDNGAHIGGLISGFLLAIVFYRKNKMKREVSSWAE